MNFIVISGAIWFGHGRMTEAILATICGLYAILLFFDPSAPFDSQATRDLAWHGYGHLIAIPFFIKSILTGFGVIANINGWRYSRPLRFCGASVGSFIWIWLLSKFIYAGVPFTFGSICAIIFFLASARIIGMALSNLPEPGSPGTGFRWGKSE